MDHAEKKCLSSHLASDWINLRGNHATDGSYVTCCKTSLPWVGKTRNKYSRFCCKSRTALYFLQQICATCNKLNCYETGLNVTSKTCNIAIPLVWQQCCKTSYKLQVFVAPITVYLHSMLVLFSRDSRLRMPEREQS